MSVITISRQSGSEGNQVTRILCERLGYRHLDKDMMLQLAKELGLDPPMVGGTEDLQHVKSFWERVISLFQSPFETGREAPSAIVDEERKAMTVGQVKNLILTAYEQGNVVIVGRGSQIVLSEKPDVLHVRVVAPLEKRIKVWQERNGSSYEDAHKKTLERDKAHVDFVKTFFNTDLRDPSLYDVVVNTHKLSPEAAADVIIEALSKIQSK